MHSGMESGFNRPRRDHAHTNALAPGFVSDGTRQRNDVGLTRIIGCLIGARRQAGARDHVLRAGRDRDDLAHAGDVERAVPHLIQAFDIVQEI